MPRMLPPTRALLAAAAAAVTLALAACSGDATSTPTPTPSASPTATATVAATAPAAPTPTPTPTPTAVPTSTPPPATETPAPAAAGTCAARFPDGLTIGQTVDEKFVCIQEPEPGASVGGGAGDAVTVHGWVAGAFEQNVVVEVLDANGTVIAKAPTTATGTDLGLFAAEWEIELTLDAAASGDSGTVHAFTTSPRDGSIDTEAEIPVAFGG